MDYAAFVLANTALGTPPLVPEIRLHLSEDVIGLWRAVEAATGATNTAPPFWAFAWAGGQAVARYVLDHPQIVKGKTVLDFGAGSGLIAIAAVKAGAASVAAADIDSFSTAATLLNTQENGVSVTALGQDVIGQDGWQTILVGDMCYERPLAERLMVWLRARHAAGTEVFIGDPGRNYFFKDGLEKLAEYRVKTPRDLEDREMRETGVYRLD